MTWNKSLSLSPARRLDRPERARRLPVGRRAHGWQVGVAVRHLGFFEGIRFGGLLGGMEGGVDFCLKAVIACKKIIQVKPVNVINSKNALLPADCSKGKSLQKRQPSQSSIAGHRFA